MRRWLKAILVGIFCGLLGVMVGLSAVGDTFERNVGLSWLFHIRGQVAPPAETVVVAIDGRTGTQLGLPSLPREWPRSVHGTLVDELVRRGASVIVFDVHFQKIRSQEHDLEFAQAVERSGRVVLVERVNGMRQPITDEKGVYTGSVWIEELIQPFPELAGAARGLGTFPLPKLEASVYEFWTFKASVGDAPTLPAVALQLYALKDYGRWRRLLEQAGWTGRETIPANAEGVNDAQQTLDLMRALRYGFGAEPSLGPALLGLIDGDASGGNDGKSQDLLRALAALYGRGSHRYLNFYGPPGTIPTIPYHAVIKGGDPNLAPGALDFTDKVVFVGFSDLFDPGQPDRFYTVFTRDDGVDLSGVEIAATAFSNLLTDRSLRPLGLLPAGLILLLFGLLAGMVVYRLPALYGVPLSIVLAIAYAAAAQLMFNKADYWLPLATPLLVQFPVALFLGLLGQYLFERRRGKNISEAISYYLPANVARDLTENRLDPNAFNKVVYSTCLATDMAGFSTIAERLNPGELASFLNDYFDTLAQPLKQHHVSVTEFRADAIMCAWTSEQPDISVRRKAILASLQAAEAIGHFKARHEMLQARLRIGLEAGNVYVGHAGGGGHFVFSIVGDCANTASRIEGLNKHMGTQILATRAVVEGVEDLLLRPLGGFVFVGKTEPLPIYEILAIRSDATGAQEQLCERFSEALDAFHGGRWEQAAELFERILRDYPEDGPARFFMARCRQYCNGENLPDDPGVIRMDVK